MSVKIQLDFSIVALDFNQDQLFSDKVDADIGFVMNKFIFPNMQKKDHLFSAILWAGDIRETKKLELDQAQYDILMDIVKAYPGPPSHIVTLTTMMRDAKKAAEAA